MRVALVMESFTCSRSKTSRTFFLAKIILVRAPYRAAMFSGGGRGVGEGSQCQSSRASPPRQPWTSWTSWDITVSLTGPIFQQNRKARRHPLSRLPRSPPIRTSSSLSSLFSTCPVLQHFPQGEAKAASCVLVLLAAVHLPSCSCLASSSSSRLDFAAVRSKVTKPRQNITIQAQKLLTTTHLQGLASPCRALLAASATSRPSPLRAPRLVISSASNSIQRDLKEHPPFICI